jgi:hypothetical protein
MDFLPQWVTDLSAGAVLLVLVVMLLTGRGIATQREVVAAEKRAETFRAAWETAMITLREKGEHEAELLENSRTTVRVLEALQAARNEQIIRMVDSPPEPEVSP